MQTRHMRSKLFRRAALAGVVSLLTVIGSAAAVAPASAAAVTRPAASQAIPVPPAGWHPKTIGRLWLNPRATTQVETLSPAACRALNQKHPGAAPNCKVRDYFLKISGNHQPLPRGTRFITANGATASRAAAVQASAAYKEFDYAWQQCATTAGGCSGWATSLEAVGVWNGSHVYQWNVYCTARSSVYDNTCTWHGYTDNGGAYLSWCGCEAMQFGENSHASIVEGGYTSNWEAGQRVWVDIFGTPFDHTQWY
jgi:hypothetical protein